MAETLVFSIDYFFLPSFWHVLTNIQQDDTGVCCGRLFRPETSNEQYRKDHPVLDRKQEAEPLEYSSIMSVTLRDSFIYSYKYSKTEHFQFLRRDI